MTYEIEVCIDNLESLPLAIEGGATRIELCSSLALGGLTPSPGMMKQAARLSSVPVYAMIRPRQGDFLFSEQDLACMLDDIDMAKAAGLDGVVIGALTADGEVDSALCRQLTERAAPLGITFHRAIDQCADPERALETIIELGCERVLTSGLAANALAGAEQIKRMTEQANGRIGIMAGAGVTPDNAAEIVKLTGVTQLHLSGKSTRASQMRYISDEAHMGSKDNDDFAIPVTSSKTIARLARAIGNTP